MVLGGVTTIGLYLFPAKAGFRETFYEFKAIFEANAIVDAFFHVFVINEISLSNIPECLDYVSEYVVNLALYGGNDYYAHNAVSAERDAMSYAANQVGTPYQPPPTVIDYWRDEIFGP